MKVMDERKPSDEQFKYKRLTGIAISVVFAGCCFIAVLMGLLFKTWIFAIVALAIGICFSGIAAVASKRAKKENSEEEEAENEEGEFEENETKEDEEFFTIDEQKTARFVADEEPETAFLKAAEETETVYSAPDEQKTVSIEKSRKEERLATDLKKAYKKRQIRVLSGSILGGIFCIGFLCAGAIMDYFVFTIISIVSIIPTIICFSLYMYYEDRIKRVENYEE